MRAKKYKRGTSVSFMSGLDDRQRCYGKILSGPHLLSAAEQIDENEHIKLHGGRRMGPFHEVKSGQYTSRVANWNLRKDSPIAAAGRKQASMKRRKS